MKTFDGRDSEGRLSYFEVPNLLLSRIAACKLVAAIPGVHVSYHQRQFSLFNDEIFCKFELGGKQFELWEPFGDNSRFHVSTKPLEACAELEVLRKCFENHRPVAGYVPLVVLASLLILVAFQTAQTFISGCK